MVCPSSTSEIMSLPVSEALGHCVQQESTKTTGSLRQSMRILRGKLVMSFPGPSPKDYKRPADEGEVQDEE